MVASLDRPRPLRRTANTLRKVLTLNAPFPLDTLLFEDSLVNITRVNFIPPKSEARRPFIFEEIQRRQAIRPLSSRSDAEDATTRYRPSIRPSVPEDDHTYRTALISGTNVASCFRGQSLYGGPGIGQLTARKIPRTFQAASLPNMPSWRCENWVATCRSRDAKLNAQT